MMLEEFFKKRDQRAPFKPESDLKQLYSLLIGIAREEGLKSIEAEGFKIEFFDKPHAPAVQTPTVEDLMAQDDMPSDDELLYYSTDHYDEIQAAKEEGAKPPATP